MSKHFFITILIFLLSYTANAMIITTGAINSSSINSILGGINQNTLILIDIDYTLVLPEAKIFSTTNSPHFTLISSLLSYRKNKHYNYDQALVNWYTTRRLQLIDTNWPAFIENLKSQGAIVLGTANLDEAWYQLINQPQQKLYMELRSLGINFTKAIADQTVFTLDTSSPHTIFYYGIIFNGGSTNKEAVIKFLKTTTLMPEQLIVFSHSESFVNQINQVTSALNINYLGFIYKGFEQFDNTSVNTDVINLQRKLLLETAKWVEDDEATSLLSSMNTDAPNSDQSNINASAVDMIYSQ